MGYSYPQKRIIVVSLLLLATVVTIVGVFLGVALRPKDGSDGSEIVGTTTNDVNIEVSEVGLWPHELSDIPIDSRIHFGTLPNGMRYMIGPTTSTTTSSSTTRTSSETLSLRLHVQAGSIDEDEGKNGLAHYVEHMLFNGLQHFGAEELIETMQSYGIEFGSHVTAHTTFDNTIYQLDLPKRGQDIEDTAFMIFRDFCDGALFLPEEIEKERGVVLNELSLRDSIEKRIMGQMLKVLIPGHSLTDRLNVLGTRESVQSLNREDMLDFYEKNYIPSRMTLVIAGDMDTYDDVVVMENRIVEAFGDMKPPPTNNYPQVLWEDFPQEGFRPAVIYEADAPFETLYLYMAQSVQTIVDTKARREHEMSLQLVYDILSARFQRIAEQPDAPIAWGGASSDVLANFVELSWIQVVPKPSGFESDTSKRQTLLSQAVTTLEHEIRRLTQSGFTEAELEVAKANVLKQYREAAYAAGTQISGSLADELIQSVATRSVASSPTTDLEVASDVLGALSVENVHQTFVEKWGTDNLSLIYVTTGQDTTEESLEKLYFTSRATAIPPADDGTPNGNDETLSEFAYTNDYFGPSSGQVVYDVMVDDLDIRQVVLSNNVRVNLKATSFEQNRIYINARFGSGRLGMPPDATGLDDLTEKLINHGGLGLHAQASLDAIFAGSSVGLEMSVEDDAFVFRGLTTPEDLNLQLQLLSAYLSDPGYRASALQMFRNEIGSYVAELQYTLTGPYYAIKRTLKGQNNTLPTEEELMSLQLEDSVAWIDDQLKTSALEISIVGDIPESVTDMLTSTIGALPQRSSYSSETHAIDFSLTSFNFPAAPQSFVFTYDSSFGSSLQASTSVAWEMPAFTGETLDEIVGLFVLERIFEDRIRVELREETGKVYGYSVSLRTNDAFNNGEFLALCLVEVDNINEVGAKLLQIAKNLSEIGISDDELLRALEPFMAQEGANQLSNPYWIDIMEQSQAKPFYLDYARSRQLIASNLTKEDINNLAAKYLSPNIAVRFEAIPMEKSPEMSLPSARRLLRAGLV